MTASDRLNDEAETFFTEEEYQKMINNPTIQKLGWLTGCGGDESSPLMRGTKTMENTETRKLMEALCIVISEFADCEVHEDGEGITGRYHPRNNEEQCRIEVYRNSWRGLYNVAIHSPFDESIVDSENCRDVAEVAGWISSRRDY